MEDVIPAKQVTVVLLTFQT